MRGGPSDVAVPGPGGGLGDEAVVELGRVEVVVSTLMPVERLEILHQRIGGGGVGGRVDNELAFLPGAFDHLGIIRGITFRRLSVRACRVKQNSRDQAANTIPAWHSPCRGDERASRFNDGQAALFTPR